MSVNKEVKKVTTNTLQKMKSAGEKISMLTAYDFSFARIIDNAGIDIILVGDSASNVMAGHETTLPVTLDPWSMVVVSRYENNAPRAEGIATLVDRLSSDGVIDSQRRRLPGRGM